jgi:type IV secretion system T-DNA border endonuclease VirD2
LSRAAQIEWWLQRVEAARRSVDAAQQDRQRPRQSSSPDDAPRPRAARPAPAQTAASAHVIIRGATLSGGRDEERRRSLPAASGGAGSGGRAAHSRSGPRDAPIAKNLSGGGAGQGGGSLARAQKLASGYQPAVVKVLSYASGAARATATGQYVQREDVPVETHDGRMLTDGQAVADEIKQWSKDFEKRTPSHDVVTVSLKLHGVSDTPEGRDLYAKAVAAAFEGHRHASRIDRLPTGEIEAHIVTAAAGGPKERFRVRSERVGSGEGGFDQKRFDYRSEAVMKARIQAATDIPGHAISIDPGKPQHGRDGVTWQLNRLIERRGSLVDDRGKAIGDAAAARNAAKEWGRSLRSQSPRDTMHLMLSSKAGPDPESLRRAARAFLHDRFADHRFLFGVHVDRETDGHIHVHAVITVKNEAGQKIHPGPSEFRGWRESYAQHAQSEGLKIVATSAMERASAQSYGARDKAIVDVAERPRPAREARDRTYSADPANQRLIDNARQRIRVAQTNPIRLPSSERDRRVVNENVVAWSTVARAHPDNGAAKDMLERLTMAQTLGAILHTIGKRVDHLTKEQQNMAITSEQMVKDLRLMNEAVSRTGDLLDGETKQQFRETSARYLETLANRVDLQRAQESGVQRLSRSEVEAIAGVNAERLITRAQDVRLKETREAASAERLANRAVEAERRQEARGGVDPQSQRELTAERAIVRGSQQSAAREAREAAAAVEAARVLAEHPAQPLPQALIQTDALVKLRAEQEKIVRAIESERAEGQSIGGQRQT